jgi:DcmR-like sensory protein
MQATAAPIPFAGSTLGVHRHVCAFFTSAEEEYATLLPFVRNGLERGERGYHFVPSQVREEHLKQLSSAGVDVRAALSRRQLEIVTPEETYRRGGRLDKEAMLALAQEVLKTGATLGFPLTRVIAHPQTVFEGSSNVNEWIEYEIRLNDVLRSYDDPVICAYDANILNGAIAVDLLRTHRVAVIGGLLYENPFFVPPKELLPQVSQRTGAPPQPYR